MSSVTGVLLCAGSSTRMGFDKLQKPVAGRCAIERSANALIEGGVTEIVFAVSALSRSFCETLSLPVPKKIVEGGAERRDSVRNAIGVSAGDIIVIHDAARCMVSPSIVRESIRSAEEFGSGIAAVSVSDTVFLSDEGTLTRLPREKLIRMQTPQTFRRYEILQAYSMTGSETADATDDCTMYALAGFTPHFIEGSEDNFKLTSPADFTRAEKFFTRYGTGFDTHRLVEGRKLILGGIDIPFEKGLLGHSDADVVTHAIMDALLGASGLPDIGHLFPDTDPAFKDADSMVLLSKVVETMARKGLHPAGVSAEIICQRPKLAPHLEAMKKRYSDILGIRCDDIALSATTTEGMNDEGKGLCISAQAVASVR